MADDSTQRRLTDGRYARLSTGWAPYFVHGFLFWRFRSLNKTFPEPQ